MQYIQMDGENSCRWKHISHTFMYLRLTTFTKKRPPMSFHLLYVLLFLFRSGAPPSHDSADYWSAHIASRPQQFQTCARLMQGWVASVGCPPPPNKNPGYSGGSASRLLSWSFLSHVAVCILNAYSVNTVYTICSIFI